MGAQGPQKWAALLPAFLTAQQHNGVYGRHAYSWPRLRHGAEYLLLRYRAEYAWLATHGAGDVPLALTEVGIDPLIRDELKPFPGHGAFRDSEWRDAIRLHYGAADPDAFYMDELAWLDAEMQKDAYVKVACVFTGPRRGDRWASYDIAGTPLVGKLEAHIASAPAELPRDWAVDDIGSFWEWIQEQQHHPPGQYPAGKDHRNTMIGWWAGRNTRGNWGAGAVDIMKPNGRLDFDWYDRVIWGDSRGRGFASAGLKLAVVMLDTVPSHMNVGGWYGRQHEAEMRQGFRGIVQHWKEINRRWVLGNEPDHNSLSPVDYAWALRVFCEGVAAADPGAEVGLTMPLSQYGAADHSTPWVRAVLNALGTKPSNLRGMNVHPYAGNNPEVAVNRNLMTSLAQFPLDYWVLEYGKSKHELLTHWDDGGERLLRVQQLAVQSFQEAYSYLTTGPYAARTKLICYHRLFDVPQWAGGMVSIGVWEGAAGWKQLLYDASMEAYAKVQGVPTLPPDEEPDMPLPPVTLVPKPAGVNVLPQGSFSVLEGFWNTDVLGNQLAKGFTTTYTQPNDLLPHTTKLAYNAAAHKSEIVPARAGGWGEYKFVIRRLLGPAEQPGQPRTLILPPDGNSAYKDFSDHVSHSLKLEADLNGTPGTVARAWLPILGETQDVATKPDGLLEVDHWRVRAELLDGATVVDAEERTYVEMVARREMDLERCWNVFTPFATFPASGKLKLRVWTQQNWPGNKPGGGGGCDFFFSGWEVIVTGAVQPPPPSNDDLSIEVAALRAHANGLLALANTLEAKGLG
jgi:hypothetical protein